MSDTAPRSRKGEIDPQALSRVATLVREATRLANTAAGTDLRSPWLDVVAETVTASGYLTDVPDVRRSEPAGSEPVDDTDARLSAAARAVVALEQAAAALDHAAGRRDHRVTLVRAALTDAIETARRIRP